MSESQEIVAFRLLEAIALGEDKAGGASLTRVDWVSADKAWILATYKECLVAVKYPRGE